MQTHFRNPWSIFDELERSVAAGSSEWPQFDIEDTDDETVLSADLAGMGEGDVEITVRAPSSSCRRRAHPSGVAARRDARTVAAAPRRHAHPSWSVAPRDNGGRPPGPPPLVLSLSLDEQHRT